MRRIHSRRRFRALVGFLLIASIVLFIETRIEAFVPQLKSVVAAKIADAAGGKMTVTIGSLYGGIVRPIMLGDIAISGADGKAAAPSLTITSIQLNYRIWDLLARQYPRTARALHIAVRDPYADIAFHLGRGDVRGFARIAETGGVVRAKGYLHLDRISETVSFVGSVADDHFVLEVKPIIGTARITGTLPLDGRMQAEVVATHLVLAGIDVSGQATSEMVFARAAGDVGIPAAPDVSGTVQLRQLVLNGKPFMDIDVSYAVSDGVVTLRDLHAADGITVSGKIVARKPYPIDLTVLLDNVNIAQLLAQVGMSGGAAVNGIANAKCTLRGTLENPQSNAQIDVRRGGFGPLQFESLSLRLSGEGPFVRIEDSLIKRPSGYCILAGDLDMRRIGKNNFFERVYFVSGDTPLAWDTIDIRPGQEGVQEITARKKVSDDIHVGVKKFLADYKIDESIRDSDEVEFEYLLQPHDSLKVSVGQQGNFFGMEHKDRF